MVKPFKLSKEEVRTLSNLLAKARVGDAPAISQFIRGCEAEITALAEDHAAGLYASRDDLVDGVEKIREAALRLQGAIDRATNSVHANLDRALYAHIAESGADPLKGDLTQLNLLLNALVDLSDENLPKKPALDRIPIANMARTFGAIFNYRPTASESGPFAETISFLADHSQEYLGFKLPFSNTAIEAALEGFGRPELRSVPGGRPPKERKGQLNPG